MTQATNTATQGGDSGGQWLLQPIGGQALRGPANYAHSVEEGIDLTDPQYAELLGEEADALGELFRGRPARFWGSTRAASEGHPKNRAIDGTRPGDEVLFLSEGSAIARATVVLKFRNRALAEKIWGLDGQGRPWEYMVAVDDVVRLALPIRNITEALGWRKTYVQSLTRQVDDQALRIHELLARRTPVVPSSGRGASGLTRDDLVQAIKGLRGSTGSKSPARHEPLALLWAVGRLVAGQDRLASWAEFQEGLGPLLEEFVGDDLRRTPVHPFWHLRTSGLWEVHGVSEDGFRPSGEALGEAQAGFSADAARLLKKAGTRARAVALLCSTYFDGNDLNRAALLERTGLGGYASASGDAPSGSTSGGRGSRTVSSPDRDRDKADLVKIIYQHECQVCQEALETRDGSYSEAAHIQGLGSPHFGVDRLENLLCLCPNHHKQFDRFGIYIDEDWSVRMTTTREAKWQLRILPEHQINSEYVAYHRDLCLASW
ncbi:HNH endonuclease [Streptomyces sp. NPDC127068]|uniref:HNH endonuclease n=1 Tax=Streptomyces sp. NPDC127068 TaxID=3347127 RepID=UPI00365DAF0B